jgi:hypothetical protein
VLNYLLPESYFEWNNSIYGIVHPREIRQISYWYSRKINCQLIISGVAIPKPGWCNSVSLASWILMKWWVSLSTSKTRVHQNLRRCNLVQVTLRTASTQPSWPTQWGCNLIHPAESEKDIPQAHTGLFPPDEWWWKADWGCRKWLKSFKITVNPMPTSWCQDAMINSIDPNRLYTIVDEVCHWW